jgi:hypothetical protein
MHNSFVHTVKRFSYLAMVLVLGSVCLMASDTKKAAPAPAAKPAAAPARPAGGGAASHPAGAGGASASHGPTTSGSHGPTTSGGSHGPTTSNPGGAKSGTTTGSHGVTTSNPRGGTTTVRTTAGGPSHPSTTGTTHPPAGPGGGKPGASGRPVAAGTKTSTSAKGNSVTTRSNGKVSDVHVANKNMDIHHGLNGSRSVSVKRADGSRVVATRGGHGYVERGYGYHGHDYARRSYYNHGRYYNGYYRGYYYHGVYGYAYAPAFYYGPAYYGWAYNPWPAPIVYAGWGWAGNPWYGYYGGWWNPYPVYAGASFWLTDYLIAQSLQASYEENQAAAAAVSTQAAMTPEVKQMISDEVKRQVALENQEAQANAQNQDIDPQSSGIARMLSDNQTHVFIAGSSLDVVQVANQAECGISQGDVLEVTAAPPASATAATATVLCSKGGNECGKNAQVQIAFTDLQEMQNHMRETIDQGLGDLQSKQGQGGLPAAPPSAKAPPTQAAFVAAAPPPEQNVAADIKQESQQADQAEQEVAKEVPPPNPAEQGSSTAAPKSAGPVTVSQGQTVDQVTATLGQPKSVVNLGTKKIYVYPDMKVTFKNGTVSDVQ